MDKLFFFNPCTIGILTYDLFKLSITKSMCCIWKIISFLEFEPRWIIWLTLKQHYNTFKFWPPYDHIRLILNPIFQNAQWHARIASPCLYVRTCQRVRNCKITIDHSKCTSPSTRLLQGSTGRTCKIGSIINCWFQQIFW